MRLRQGDGCRRIQVRTDITFPREGGIGRTITIRIDLPPIRFEGVISDPPGVRRREWKAKITVTIATW